MAKRDPLLAGARVGLLREDDRWFAPSITTGDWECNPGALFARIMLLILFFFTIYGERGNSKNRRALRAYHLISEQIWDIKFQQKFWGKYQGSLLRYFRIISRMYACIVQVTAINQQNKSQRQLSTSCLIMGKVMKVHDKRVIVINNFFRVYLCILQFFCKLSHFVKKNLVSL